MPIATQADVEALLLRPLTPEEAVYLPTLLEVADGVISGYLPGVSFEAGSETVTVTSEDGGTVWLPHRPITGIDAVEVGGTPLAATAYTWTPWGPLILATPIYGTGWATPTIEVAYDYGATALADVRLVAAELVVARMTNPGGAKQETVGSYSVTYDAPTTASQLSDDQRRILDPYRRPVTSVRVEREGAWGARRCSPHA